MACSKLCSYNGYSLCMGITCGLDHKNLPFGIQLIAPAGNDAKLSEIALAIEDTLSNHEETKRAIPDIV